MRYDDVPTSLVDGLVVRAHSFIVLRRQLGLVLLVDTRMVATLRVSSGSVGAGRCRGRTLPPRRPWMAPRKETGVGVGVG